MAPINRYPWFGLLSIGRTFFLSPMRWRAVWSLSAIIALLLTLNALNVANSYVGRNFMTAIALRDREQYLRFAVLYLGVFAASAITGVSQQFMQDRLALSWRDWLTRHLIHRYLSGCTFDRISAKSSIDNPDQRIAEDVHTFTGTLLSFVVMITNSALTTIAFAGVLWSISRVLLLTAILYAAVGSVFTVLLGYPLVALNSLQLKKEADLRYGLIHVREHGLPLGERDEPQEARRIQARLRRVVRNSRAMIGVTRNVGFFTSGYNYLVPILPLLIVAPLYLRGKIELGVVTQSAMAFAQLLGAFSLVVAQFQSISAFAAVVRRLSSLCDEMEVAEEEGGPKGLRRMSDART
jgi:vitamin B12/bleomycin/antimicrobial peptide transport system ATP-binding/permease protein